MYEDRYGTDWERLDPESAIERAYALGVLAELGEGLPEEYDRVRTAIGSGPDSNMIELAYEEGRQAVADVDVGERTDREAWEDLIEEADSRLVKRGGEETEHDEEAPASKPPSSLAALEGPDDDPSMLDFPAFLRRE